MGNKMQGKYLRNSATGLWLTGEGSFSQDLEQAQKVETILEAMDLCRRFGLRDMELVLKFDDSNNDTSLPMTDM